MCEITSRITAGTHSSLRHKLEKPRPAKQAETSLAVVSYFSWHFPHPVSRDKGPAEHCLAHVGAVPCRKCLPLLKRTVRHFPRVVSTVDTTVDGGGRCARMPGSLRDAGCQSPPAPARGCRWGSLTWFCRFSPLNCRLAHRIPWEVLLLGRCLSLFYVSLIHTSRRQSFFLSLSLCNLRLTEVKKSCGEVLWT